MSSKWCPWLPPQYCFYTTSVSESPSSALIESKPVLSLTSLSENTFTIKPRWCRLSWKKYLLAESISLPVLGDKLWWHICVCFCVKFLFPNFGPDGHILRQTMQYVYVYQSCAVAYTWSTCRLFAKLQWLIHTRLDGLINPAWRSLSVGNVLLVIEVTLLKFAPNFSCIIEKSSPLNSRDPRSSSANVTYHFKSCWRKRRMQFYAAFLPLFGCILLHSSICAS